LATGEKAFIFIALQQGVRHAKYSFYRQ